MAKKSVDLSLILPCYNETPVFAGSWGLIHSILEASTLSYEVIFVDDCSSDKTVNMIRAVVAGNSNTKALYHEKNMGRGRAVADGIRLASGSVAGYIDIDCEVSPVYIPPIVKEILKGKTDMVVGERIYRSSFGSVVREVLSVGYRRLVATMLPTGSIDTESGYKFFSRKKILPIIEKTRDPHWFWDTEIIVRARLAKLNIIQVPVLFLRRFDKKSSVNIFKDTMSYLVSITKLKKQLAAEGILV